MAGIIRKALDFYEDSKSAMRAQSILVCGTSACLTIQYNGDPIYHASGFLAALIAWTTDVISTIPVIKFMNTSEFKKSKLKDKYYESNIIIGKNPTMQQYCIRSGLSSLLFLAAGTALPPIGYSYLSVSPFLADNNIQAKKRLKKSLEHVVNESLTKTL